MFWSCIYIKSFSQIKNKAGMFNVVSVQFFGDLHSRDGGQFNRADQMKPMRFSESGRNWSGHSWPPAPAACVLKWHSIRDGTAFVQNRAAADAAGGLTAGQELSPGLSRLTSADEHNLIGLRKHFEGVLPDIS